MKKLKLLFLVVLVSLGLVGCEETVKPINQYYALITELHEKMNIGLVYMDNNSEFKAKVNEINSLIKRSSEVELTEDEEKEEQNDVDKKAKKFLTAIKKARSVIVASNKKEKNNDYSDVNKSNSQLTKYDNAYNGFYNAMSKVVIDVEENSRRELLDKYALSFTTAQLKTYAASNYRHTLAMKDSISQKDIKNLEKKIKEAKSEIVKLNKLEVNDEDKNVREYKEEKLNKILSEASNSIKYLKKNNTYRNNQITQKINVLSNEAGKNIYYNIDVKPYLIEDNAK